MSGMDQGRTEKQREQQGMYSFNKDIDPELENALTSPSSQHC
jgi:hypothetical protein